MIGWIVTFIEQKRGGGTSAGYISSGFFGGELCSERQRSAADYYRCFVGLMLGRVVLIWLNRKVR